MNGQWKDLFAFNKRERNGIFVLCALILLLLLMQVVMPYFVKLPAVDNTAALDAYIIEYKKDSLRLVDERKLALQAKRSQYYKKSVYNDSSSNRIKQPKRWSPVPFDPNSAMAIIWEGFGLSDKQSSSILNYLKKGGKFRVKSDVKKMYVIDDILYSKMEAYIQLPDSIEKKKWNSNFKKDTIKTTKPFENIYIELNSTDTTELKKLKGIGSYYARQIIYYRDKLGGYVSVNQLYEIERMRESTIEKILPYISVDSTNLRKIKLNSAKAPEMVKHPYITWNMAINIHDYREFTKKYKYPHQLVELGLLNEEIYSKLVGYLEL